MTKVNYSKLGNFVNLDFLFLYYLDFQSFDDIWCPYQTKKISCNRVHFASVSMISLLFFIFFLVMGIDTLVSILVIGLVCTFYTAIVSIIGNFVNLDFLFLYYLDFQSFDDIWWRLFQKYDMIKIAVNPITG
jgi:hypothetical protein